MSQQHLCFYSARCRVCQAFLEQLASTPFSKEFRFICVDPGHDGRRPQLPAYVKAVPTLMIAGEPEPRVDNQVMNWLMERKLKARSDVAPGGGFMGAATGMGGAAGGGGPMALYANEMGGIGDEGFAFIGEEGFSGEKSTVRLSSTMTGINDVAHSMVPDARVFGSMMGGPMMSGAGPSSGPGTAGPTGRQSEKAKAFDTAYQAFLADRDRGMPKGIQRM